MVHDIEATANFYKDKLGFHYHRFWGEPPGFCILHRGAFSVMINRVDVVTKLLPNHVLSKNYWDIYFWTNDVRTLKDEFESNGLVFFQPLFSGRKLIFGQNWYIFGPKTSDIL